MVPIIFQVFLRLEYCSQNPCCMFDLIILSLRILRPLLPWPPPMFGLITEFCFFKRIISFDFGGDKKFFLIPKRTYLALEISGWGGHTSKTVLPSVAPKPYLRSKSLRSMIPKKWVSKAEERFLGLKKFFGPPKIKNWFPQKDEFCDLSEHGGWSREWPQPPWWCQTSWFNLLNPLPAFAPCEQEINNAYNWRNLNHQRWPKEINKFSLTTPKYFCFWWRQFKFSPAS